MFFEFAGAVAGSLVARWDETGVGSGLAWKVRDMARGPVVIRDAGPADAETLLMIWSEFSPGDKKAFRSLPSVAEATAAMSRVAADPEERLVVAELAGQVVGLAHLRRAPISPIHTEDSVRVSYLHVVPQHRRRGIAHQLLEVAVGWAEEKGTEHVTATAWTGSRDANRFLARLGLVPQATLRTGAVKALHAKLVARDGATVSTNLLVARRLMRRRAAREAAMMEDQPIYGWPGDDSVSDDPDLSERPLGDPSVVD